MSDERPRDRRLVRALRAGGAAGGLALALTGALAPLRPSGLGEGAGVAARVNGRPIRSETLAQVAARLGLEASGPPDARARAEVLERLVDEELLVQRALEIGLVASDRGVRKAIALAAIDVLAREVEAAEPGEAELRAFHAEHGALFAVPGRARVRGIAFGAAEGSADGEGAALRRAREAAAAIAAGMPFEEAAARFGEPDGLLVPDALLPELVLRRTLGPTLAAAALALAPGEISAPVASPAGVHLLAMVERAPPRPTPFETAREAVRRELRRRAREEALAALLARLRRASHLALAPGAPRP